MGITLDREYAVLISITDINGEGSKKDVLDNIQEKNYLVLDKNDLKEKDNRKELKWRNDLAYTRKGLQNKKCIDGSQRNNWKITDKGRIYLLEVCKKICEDGYKSEKLSDKAIERGKLYIKSTDENDSIKTNIEKLYLNITDGFPEGKYKERLHKYKERNPKVIKEAKTRFQKEKGYLYCEVCGFNFEKTYGILGKDYIEGHHIKPVSELNEGDITNVNDILLVCSNCHSMLHKKRPCLSRDELRELLNK